MVSRDALSAADAQAAASAQEYAAAYLAPTLVPALKDLCRERPHEPIEWLARWLLEHKPTTPCQPATIAPPDEQQTVVHVAPQEDYHKAFSLVDRNGDGELSKAEMIRGCRQKAEFRRLVGLPDSYGDRVLTPELRDSFEVMLAALNADGSVDAKENATIQFDEFVKFCEAVRRSVSRSVCE